MSEEKRQDVKEIAELALRGAEVKRFPETRSGYPHREHRFAIVPEGHTVVDLNKFIPDGPVRVEREARIDDVGDFIAYVQRFSTLESTIYFDMEALSFLAVLDHDSPALPGTGLHRACCKLKPTPVFNIWAAAHGKYMGQDEFAEWLEEQEVYVLEPDAATVLEAVRALRLSSKVEFQRIVNDASGAVSMIYEDDVRQTGTICLPSVLVVPLQVFHGAAPVNVQFLLRYRLSGGRVALGVKAPSLQSLQRQQVDAVFNRVLSELNAESYIYRGVYGRP